MSYLLIDIGNTFLKWGTYGEAPAEGRAPRPQGERPRGDRPCLVSCVVVPGFDFADFELGASTD